MKVSIIAAVAENRAIGKDNDLIWNLPDDLRFFKKTTEGKVVIMGRKNFESIPESYRPLPNRKNIVVTHQDDYEATGAQVVGSIEEALKNEQDQEEVFIIGGGQIYQLALDHGLVDQMYITEVHHSFDADAFFPKIDKSRWLRKVIGEHSIDEKHKYSFTYCLYTKK